MADFQIKDQICVLQKIQLRITVARKAENECKFHQVLFTENPIGKSDILRTNNECTWVGFANFFAQHEEPTHLPPVPSPFVKSPPCVNHRVILSSYKMSFF